MQVGDKVIKLREEHELLGRFQIIHGSHPHLDPKLEQTIGRFKMAMVPRSLCAGDGTLLLTADKANLMKALEDVKAQSLHDIQQDFIEEDLTQYDSIEEADATIKVLIIDAMAVLQCMKKKNTMQILRIQSMVSGYDEVRVVFDQYMDQSLKNKTRQKTAATSVEYEIHPDMKLTMSIKDLLSASSTKKKLTFMLGEGLLKYFSSDSSIVLFVLYDTFIKGHGFEQVHTHEEADTLIPHQVLASVTNGTM